MHTVGIIAEYNPFHTGHAYHIARAKELAGADYAVVVMSPDFVQRGEPAVFDKYTRAGMALSGGADLVLGLPVCFATGSAEYFAEGAIALLDAIGVTDTVCFGAESDDLPLFLQTADVTLKEPEDFVQELRALQRKGLTYPQARSAALSACIRCRNADQAESSHLSEFLASPNNILGIEYCKALKKRGSRITPLPLLRKGSGYHSTALADTYCSATAIRTAIRDGHVSDSLPYIPQECRALFLDSCRTPVVSDDFMACLIPKLLARDAFDDILDITSDLSDRICSLRSACIGSSFEEAVSLLKTRQITQARIRRSLLHLLLEIRSDETECFRAECAAPYAKVLGFRRTASPLLRAIKENGTVPLITKNAKARTVLDARALQMWKQDLSASHLYRGIRSNRYRLPFRSEYEISPVIFSS